ncbi:MAG: imidazole glycerol phosphate synthase subunit HisH [Brevundimonas sp.]|nr:MAG: imidazole glycerol phosphate synthase subunit HisH [Brevundimonas sp.]
MIGVIDYGMGNLRSVANAFYENGLEVEVISEPDRLEDYSHLVLPGVGHFGKAVKNIDERGFRGPLAALAAAGRPMLGLCVGMQLLAEVGTEGGESRGLGLVAGRVTAIPPAPGKRIPHVGWNELNIQRDHPVFNGLKQGRDFYFVHSYQFDVADPDNLLGSTDYEGQVTAVVGRANVIGFQFHPEKSQVNGAKLLENFADWDGVC